MKRILVIVLLSLVTGIACAQDEASDKGVRYVKVDTSSNDAVMQDSTDLFESNPLCRLHTNQKVTVLEETEDGYVKIRALCKGKQVEGWVKKVILADKIVAKTPKVTESGSVPSAAMGSAASVGHGISPMEAEKPAEPESDDPPR
jgi:hypothetical protein